MDDDSIIPNLLARLSAVEAVASKVASLEARVEVMDDDVAEPQKRWVAESAGGAAAAEYSSYFKVYDASSGGTCKVGVKDGSIVVPMENHCGGVWINGVYCAVANAETEAEGAGEIYAWLISRITEDGEEGVVAFTSSATAPSTGGIAGSTQLLGRASIASDGGSGYVVAAINQDYLRGGEHLAVLYADCGLLTVAEA